MIVDALDPHTPFFLSILYCHYPCLYRLSALAFFLLLIIIVILVPAPHRSFNLVLVAPSQNTKPVSEKWYHIPIMTATTAATIIVPEQEVEELYQMYHELSSTEDIQQHYKAMMSKLTNSMESLHLALFQIEQDIKDPFILLSFNELSVTKKQLADLEMYLNDRLTPFITITLSEVNDNILCTMTEDSSNYAFAATKLQLDLSNLRSYIVSINNLTSRKSETLVLHQEMEQLFVKMEAISDAIFDFQERRMISAVSASSTTATTAPLTSASTSVSTSSLSHTLSFVQSGLSQYTNAPSLNGTLLLDEDTSHNSFNSVIVDHCTHINTLKEMHGCSDDQQDVAMATIDALFNSVLQSMDQLFQNMTLHQHQQQQQQLTVFSVKASSRSVACSASITGIELLERKFEKLRLKWEEIISEREDLKASYKEERWFNVFLRVADQVNVMMDGLDRSISQCYSFIQNAWQQQQGQEEAVLLPPTPTSSTYDSSRYMTKKPSCLILTKSEQDKFKSLEKSFEAKMKYYTPSIDRMLSMLGNGIQARTATASYQHQGVVLRHEAILQRWQHIKDVMEDLRMRDIPEMERMLTAPNAASSHNSFTSIPPIPPATPTSIMSNGSSSNNRNWKSIRYHATPEPLYSPRENHGHIMQNATSRSATPNSLTLEKLSSGKSPQQQLHSVHQQQYQPQQQALQDFMPTKGFGSPGRRAAASPKPVRQPSTRFSYAFSNSPKIAEDFYEEDERHFGIDISKMVQQQQCLQGRCKTPTALAANSKRSNSSTTRHLRTSTPQQEQQQRVTANRAKLRSKSSMGHLMTDRAVPGTSSQNNTNSGCLTALPMQRRAMTPSLIPRPTTKDSTISRLPSSSPAAAGIAVPSYGGRRSSSTSTSIIPGKQQKAIPPVPPLPKYVALRQQQQQRRLTNSSDDTHSISSSSTNSNHYQYHPDSKDLLDMEVAKIINSSPITMECQRVEPIKHPGKYYFGNDAVSVNAEAGNSRKKMYTCKLMTYEGRGRRGSANRHQQAPSSSSSGIAKNNKVLVRVGGGWQDFEFFLLEHSSLMSSNAK